MMAQRTRLEAASANLANASSTRTALGNQYQRRDVVFTAQDVNEEWRTRAAQNGLYDGTDIPAMGVKTEVSISDRNQYQSVYSPGHPDADANGYVRMPDVDPIEETVNMMSAARSFESNATAFNTAKELARVSINLGDA